MACMYFIIWGLPLLFKSRSWTDVLFLLNVLETLRLPLFCLLLIFCVSYILLRCCVFNESGAVCHPSSSWYVTYMYAYCNIIWGYSPNCMKFVFYDNLSCNFHLCQHYVITYCYYVINKWPSSIQPPMSLSWKASCGLIRAQLLSYVLRRVGNNNLSTLISLQKIQNLSNILCRFQLI